MYPLLSLLFRFPQDQIENKHRKNTKTENEFFLPWLILKLKSEIISMQNTSARMEPQIKFETIINRINFGASHFLKMDQNDSRMYQLEKPTNERPVIFASLISQNDNFCNSKSDSGSARQLDHS